MSVKHWNVRRVLSLHWKKVYFKTGFSLTVFQDDKSSLWTGATFHGPECVKLQNSFFTIKLSLVAAQPIAGLTDTYPPFPWHPPTSPNPLPLISSLPGLVKGSGWTLKLSPGAMLFVWILKLSPGAMLFVSPNNPSSASTSRKQPLPGLRVLVVKKRHGGQQDVRHVASDLQQTRRIPGENQDCRFLSCSTGPGVSLQALPPARRVVCPWHSKPELSMSVAGLQKQTPCLFLVFVHVKN